MNLQSQFNHNVGRAKLAQPLFYAAFKEAIENRKEFIINEDGSITLDAPYKIVGNIGIIDFKGFTVGECDPLEEIVYGCISMIRFQEDLQALADNEAVTKIIINFNSGGGYIQGIFETAELVSEINQKKPIYGYTAGFMCSAAYRVACRCSALIASPSSYIGSVGVYSEYFDYTGMMDKAGVIVKTFQGGSKKTIGSPYISLTKEQEQEIQDDINNEWAIFKDEVRASRGDVKEEFLQGQAFSGKDAVSLQTKLVDGNLNTLKQFVDILSAQFN